LYDVRKIALGLSYIKRRDPFEGLFE